MYATSAPPTPSSLFPLHPARHNWPLDATRDHEGIASRLVEIAHAEAREHVLWHGQAEYHVPNEIGRMAHVLAILRDRGMCHEICDHELREFTATYWGARESMGDFLAMQLSLFAPESKKGTVLR
jgi:hypothetical protein